MPAPGHARFLDGALSPLAPPPEILLAAR